MGEEAAALSEFEDKLNAILSNPDAMAQVMNLAQSLGGSGIPGGPPHQSDPLKEQTGAREPTPARGPTDGGAAGLGDLLSQIDPALIGRLLPLLGELNRGGDDERLQLLYALRPFLKPERQEKVERAVKAAKLIHIGKKFLTTMGEPYV